MDVASAYRDCFRLPLRNLQSHFSRDAANVPLELTHTSFSRVARGHQFQSLVGNLQLTRHQSVLLDLARNEIPQSNLELLRIAISGQRNDLHAVSQRRRDRSELVGSGNEKYVR